MAEPEPRDAGRRRGADAAAPPARVLPHNLELESAVLAVLLDGSHATAMQSVREQAEHPLVFFHRDHRIVYQACLCIDDLEDAEKRGGNRVDATAVIELLSRFRYSAMMDRLRQQEVLFESDQLDGIGRERYRRMFRRDAADLSADPDDSALAAIGGPGTVAELVSRFGAAAGVRKNAELLRDLYLKRRLISRVGRLVDQAHLTTDGFPVLVDGLGQAALDLGRLGVRSEVVGMDQAVHATLEAIQRQQDSPGSGVHTGLPDLDRVLLALRPGGLYIFAARPGVGKTSLALKIASHVAGHPAEAQGVLFVTLEVDHRDLVKKLLAAESGVSFRKLDQGEPLEAHEAAQLAETATRIKPWPFEVMDLSDLTAPRLRSVVKRRALDSRGALRLVVIDYLGLLQGSRPDQTEYEKLSEITRLLKVTAKELGLPILALAQMNRDVEKGGGGGREPKLSDLRGSGTIEQDADAVVFLHRTGGDDASGDGARRIKLVVAKNRWGETGSTNLVFFPAKLRFEQAAPEEWADEGGDGGDEGGGGQGSGARPGSRQDRLRSAPSRDEDPLV